MASHSPPSREPKRFLRVLMVEDCADDSTFIVAELSRIGYAPEFVRVDDADGMRVELGRQAWDIVLSDYDLPQFSGLAALAVLRETGLDVPFIVISGTISDGAAVAAMQAGAHDYVMKDNLARLGPAIERELADAAVRRDRRAAQLALNQEAALSAALAKVAGALIPCSDPAELLRMLGQVTMEVLECDCSYTLLRDPRDGSFMLTAGAGWSAAEWEEAATLQIPVEAVTGLLSGLGAREVLQIDIAAVPSRFAALPQHFGVTAVLYLGLRHGEQIVGIHAAGFRGRREPFTQIQERIAAGIGQLASMLFRTVRLVEELESANRLKSDFVATMSHELRTPLNIIVGYTDLLLEGQFDELSAGQTGALQPVAKNARALLELISTTLDLSRLEKGDLPFRPQDVDLVELLTELEQENPDWREKPGVRLEREVSPQARTLRTDPIKLKMVLRNLVANALKFTTEGHVSIGATAGHGGVEIAVADSGIGIAAQHLGTIFDPFRQLEPYATRHHGGTGLGLYIVRRLLDVLGGAITVESELGRGSTFRVWLPEK